MKYVKTFEKFSLYQKLFGKDGNTNESDIHFKEHSENVRKLQNNLEKLGFKLFAYGVDGIFGSETLGQVKSLFSFLKNHSEFNEYIDDDNLLNINNKSVSVEQQELIEDLANNDDVKAEITNHFSKIEHAINDRNLIGEKEISEHIEDPEEFTKKLIEISKRLQINPNWLLTVMWKESKINPKAVNPKSHATGLIQFMPKTAKGLGTSVHDLRNMSGVEQLDYVYKYFKRYTGRIHSVQDLYMITFFPIALDKDDDFIIQSKDASAEKIAKQNPAVDLDKNGEITKGEFNQYVSKGLPKQWKEKTNNA